MASFTIANTWWTVVKLILFFFLFFGKRPSRVHWHVDEKRKVAQRKLLSLLYRFQEFDEPVLSQSIE